MQKIEFVNGTTIDGAATFNQMQDNVEDVFEGNESMGSIVVEDITCKNIFDGIWENGAYNNTSGAKIDSTTIMRNANPIFVNSNTDYIISKNGNGATMFVHEYTIDGTFIKTYTSGSGTKITTSSTTGYINISRNVGDTLGFQVEKGEFATTYTPFKRFEYDSVNSMGKIVVDDIQCKNFFDGIFVAGDIVDERKTTRLSTRQYLYIEAGTYTVSTNLPNTYQFSITTNDVGCPPLSAVPTLTYDSGFNAAGTTTKTFTITKTGYLVLFLKKANDGNVSLNDIAGTWWQIENGDIATNPVEYKEFSNKQIYSTNEQVIGTWIDGKPLYRKVINWGTLPSDSNAVAKAHDISNIDTIVNIRGTSSNGETTLPIPISNPVGLQYQISMSANLYNLIIQTGGDRSAYTKTYVILEYTKTTDTATASVSTLSLEEGEE